VSLSAALWREADEMASRCLAHPFLRGIADGTLPVDRYRDFVAQDAFFLEVFARGYAYCLATAPDGEGLYAFYRLLRGVFDEIELHRGVASELDIDLDHVTPAVATLAYTGFLENRVRGGATTGETLAAMTPCMRLYAYLGRQLAAGDVAKPYRDWVGTYAADEFEELASLIEGLLDRYANPAGVSEREYYHRAMELEYRFFDAAWKGPTGGS
jgi:thiaminase (transcriptional activator TenA)